MRYVCEIDIRIINPWVLRMEIKKDWCRHDIIMHAIKKGYLSEQEAQTAKGLRRDWVMSLDRRKYIPLDITSYHRYYMDRALTV